MRVSREKAAENRERIVDTASRLFREKGFDGVGLDAIMKDAGLTHGGFYGHFGSKDDLAAEAVTRALERSMKKQGRFTNLDDLVSDYMSERHRADRANGCPRGSGRRHCTPGERRSSWPDGICARAAGPLCPAVQRRLRSEQAQTRDRDTRRNDRRADACPRGRRRELVGRDSRGGARHLWKGAVRSSKRRSARLKVTLGRIEVPQLARLCQSLRCSKWSAIWGTPVVLPT